MNKQYNNFVISGIYAIKDGTMPSFFSLSANVMTIKFAAIKL